jgi:hypothetical protein
MPRYLVERTFPDCLDIPTNDTRARAGRAAVLDSITEVRVLDPYFYLGAGS